MARTELRVEIEAAIIRGTRTTVPGACKPIVDELMVGPVGRLLAENETLGSEIESLMEQESEAWDQCADFRMQNASLRTETASLGAGLDALRAEKETLRAERDAAIARAEEAERRLQLDRQMAPERIAEMVEEYGAYDATCKLGKVYGTATIGEFVSALLATAKLAQAEGEIATLKQQLGEQYMLRAKAGNAIMRLRMAFLVLTESGHGGAIHAVRKWFSDGAEGPVPFYRGALFEAWAAAYGISNVDGFMGYRATIKLTTPEPPHGD